MKLGEKLSAIADGGKYEIDIQKEQSEIHDATKDIGKKVIEILDANGSIDSNEEIKALYEKIKASRAKIEELKSKQDGCKSKL